MNNFNLPGIKKIYLVPCHELPPHLLEHSISGLPTGLMCPTEEVDFVGNPKLEIKSTAMHNRFYEKAELTFNTYQRLEYDTPQAIVVEDVEGNTWLMGYREAPYPIFEFTDSLGFPGEPKKIEYVITFLSEKALISVG